MQFYKFHLDEINFLEVRLVKERIKWYGEQDHSRWIFADRTSWLWDRPRPRVYKIWNPTYVRRDNLLAGLEAGFYNEEIVPALLGPIFHDGICRGYVMEACQRHARMVDWFYETIKRRTRETGYFYYDFSRYQIMRYGNRLSLVDLEGVYPLEDAPNLDRFHCVFAHDDYRDFVMHLLDP
jgi:hypothetical protein